jgi:hypothetical protein
MYELLRNKGYNFHNSDNIIKTYIPIKKRCECVQHMFETNYALRSEDVFVITCVANLMEVKVLFLQQDLRYEIFNYWRFNV